MQTKYQGGSTEGAGAYLPATVLLLASTILVGWLNFRSVDAAAPTLAVFSPQTTFEHALAATLGAGGNVIAKGPLPFSIIVQSGDPSFFDRLRRAGAWLLLDPKGGGCTDRKRPLDKLHDQ